MNRSIFHRIPTTFPLVVVVLLLLLSKPALAQATSYSQDFNSCSNGAGIDACDGNIVPKPSADYGEIDNGTWKVTPRSEFYLNNYTWHNVCLSFDAKQIPNGIAEFAVNLRTRTPIDFSTFDDGAYAFSGDTYISDSETTLYLDESLMSQWNNFKVCSIDAVKTLWFNGHRVTK